MKIHLITLHWCYSTALALPSWQKRQLPAPSALQPGIAMSLFPIKSLTPVKRVEHAGTSMPGSKRAIIKLGPIKLAVSGASSGNMPMGHSHGKESSPAPKASGGLSDLSVTDIITALLGGDSDSLMNKLVPSMDPNSKQIVRKVQPGVGICQNCSVLKGRIFATDENDKELSVKDGVYIHHLLLIPSGLSKVKDMVEQCNGTVPPPNPVISQGTENFTTIFTALDGKFKSGYRVGDASWILQGEIINYKPTAQNIYLNFDYEYLEGHSIPSAFTAITTMTGCYFESPEVSGTSAPASFTIKQGKSTILGKKMVVKNSGTILNARGHMHEGAVDIKMMINNQTVCNSKASYAPVFNDQQDSNGKKWETISEMSTCVDAIHVKQGDVLRIDANFDTHLHPMRQSNGKDADAMGVFFYTWVPDA